MATTKKAMFPTVVYGIIVNNVSEGREVCKKHEAEVAAARAAKAKAFQKEEAERLRNNGFSESEARFLAMGGVPCNSVSTFV